MDVVKNTRDKHELMKYNSKYQQNLFVLIQFPKECVCDKLSQCVQSFSSHFKDINNLSSYGCFIK